jgi:hypothetical protein
MQIILQAPARRVPFRPGFYQVTEACIRCETLTLKQAKMRKRNRKGPAGQKTIPSRNAHQAMATNDTKRNSGQIPSEWLIKSVGERSLSPRQIALKYSISREKARLIIIAIMGDDKGMKPKNKGRGSGPIVYVGCLSRC